MLTKRVGAAGAAVAMFWVGTAFAEIRQTDAAGTLLPQPVSENEIRLSSDLGWDADQQMWLDFDGNTLNPPAVYSDFFPNFVTGDAVRLEGLFKWRGEQLDPVADARIEPGYFSPSCGFTGELVLRGGNCNVAFGWYNVLDPNDPTPPAPSEIYELIPSDTETYMQCMTQNGQIQPEGTGFCPFGWDNHHPYNPPQLAWIPTAFDSGLIASDSRYLGGYVAFALIGNPSIQCNQTKYSIAAHNVKNPSGQPWITTLIWQSTVDPEGFYMAFEDLPMTQADWTNPGPGQAGTNDGDFNDFVYFITGISCEGGGEPCDTGLVGACSIGRTDCKVGDQEPLCRPIVQPGAELCDNVDNDCDGVVDNGEGLCPDGYACEEGKCVTACGTGEFECDMGLVCRDGLCIDAACVDVQCEVGQVCRDGVCQDPCAERTCPDKQECQLGRCVDPCKGVVCPASRVCERGLCVSNCQCRGCDEGKVCGADGLCTDPACEGVVCEAGLVCQLGDCVDPCAIVNCPGDVACQIGPTGDAYCPDPSAQTPGSPGQGGDVSIDPGQTSSGGTGPRPTDPSDPANAANPEPLDSSMGCGCRLTGKDRSRGALGLLLAALGLVLRRRRAPPRA